MKSGSECKNEKHSYRKVLLLWGWGAGDSNKSLLQNSAHTQDYYDPSIAFGLPPRGLDWMGSQRQ